MGRVASSRCTQPPIRFLCANHVQGRINKHGCSQSQLDSNHRRAAKILTSTSVNAQLPHTKCKEQSGRYVVQTSRAASRLQKLTYRHLRGKYVDCTRSVMKQQRPKAPQIMQIEVADLHAPLLQSTSLHAMPKTRWTTPKTLEPRTLPHHPVLPPKYA